MSDRVCPNCKSSAAVRSPRSGILQTNIFPLFGFYPWECVECFRIYLHRSRAGSHHRRQETSAPDVPTPPA